VQQPSRTKAVITDKRNVSKVFSHCNFLRPTLIDSKLSMHVYITVTQTWSNCT